MSKINILVLSYHACIRVIKQALAMLGNVENVNFIFMQTTVANKDLINVLPNATFYDTPEMLAAKLKGFRGMVDLVHCHNEPDWMGPIVKEVLPDVPLVYDVHDLASMRDFAFEPMIEMEKDAMRAADAFVFVSQGYEREARDFHDIPATKPSIVLYSYCFGGALAFDRYPRVRGVCYEGNLTTENHPKIAYRNHVYAAKFFRDHNIPFAVYGGDGATQHVYAREGAICCTSLSYSRLIGNLARWDWGFVGHADYTKTLEYCMPNKMFEYIAAGIPVICCNAPEAGEWAEENGVGVNIKSLHQIPEFYNRHEELREVVEQKRKEFIMENEIPKLMDLYGEVLNG